MRTEPDVRAEAGSTAAIEKRKLAPAAKVEALLSPAPESLVLELLRNIRADVARVDEKVDTKVDAAILDLRSEMQSLRADIAADFVTVNAKIDAVRKETSEQLVGLRRAVVEYDSAALGHGVLISELGARVRHIERHLSLPGMDAS